MGRGLLLWVGCALLLLGGTIAGVIAANASVFSASGFVRVYLGALARGDAAAAATVPGVSTAGLDTGAIATAALPGLDGVRVVSDTEVVGGHHLVEVSWTSRGVPGRSTFDVASDGTRLLLFPAWRFGTSPIATLTATPQGDTRYRIGTVRLDSAPPTGAAARRVALLVPGVYRVDMASAVATAPALDVIAASASAVTASPLGRATPAFTTATEQRIRQALAGCAAQKALYPAGCPFGADITDRITSSPSWTIVDPGTVTLAPTADPGYWTARLGGGTARLSVQVQSLFDGSIGFRTVDVPILGSYPIVVDGDAPALAGPAAG